MAGFRSASYAPVLDAIAPQTNPTTASVLADTGALPSALYEVRAMVGCTVAAIFQLQRRNAANGANVGDVVYIRAAAGQTGEYILKYEINKDERLRILPAANITGDAEATIQVERMV
jgi:hypothetical protein